MTNNGIALWDNTKHRFIAKDMTNLDLTYGNTTVDFAPDAGMTINGQARFTYDGGTTKDVPMDIDLPIVAGEGITIDKENGQEKVEVKLDTALTDSKYVEKATTPSSVSYIYAFDKYGDKQFPVRTEADNFSIPFRAVGGTLKVGTAVEDSDAMPKKQVEDGFVAKQTTTPKALYGVDSKKNQINILYTEKNTAWTIAQRKVGGILEVGTPVGVNDATTKAYVDGLNTITITAGA